MRITRIAAAGLVLILAINLASMGVAATGVSDGVTQISSIDVSVEDEHITVDGLSVSGEGLPSVGIDERTYELDSAAIQSDGVTINIGDRTYEVCSVDISLENVSVTISDVSINSD